MSFKKGDVVLAPFPFTDLTQAKLRPAVVLCASATGSNDTTICFISSQNLTGLNSTEFLIEDSDAEFSGTGLKVSSKVIVSRVVTIDRNLITRRLGKLGANHRITSRTCSSTQPTYPSVTSVHIRCQF